MKASSVKWLHLTVFYHHAEWHQLLGQCLSPVLGELKERQWIEGYHIYFNTERGDSIQLALSAYQSHANDTLERIRATIADYIQEHPAAPGDEEYCNTRFFKDFPANEIRYHLFTIETKDTISMAAEDQEIIHCAVSAAMVYALCTDEISNENLFALSVYLILAAIKKYDQSRRTTLEVLEGLLTAGANDLGETPLAEVVDNDNWRALYEENQETFEEILSEVREEATRPEVLHWLKDWEIKWQTITSKYNLERALAVLLPVLFKHFGLHFSATVSHSMYGIIYKIINAAETRPGANASVIKAPPAVTAIVTVWKRDHLQEQMDALMGQTLPPSKIWIYHCREFIAPDPMLARKYPQIAYQYNTDDLGYFGRFSLGLHAPSPFLFIMDDDVIPSCNWLEKCYQLSTVENAIISSAGRRLPVDNLLPEIVRSTAHSTSCFFGDSDERYSWNVCKSDTIVDYGCNSWFIKKEWLQHFWSIQPYTFETGEDIHLSLSCLLRAGIRTICPAQDLQEACGNLKKVYGFDHYASWKDGQFSAKREKIFKYWIKEHGWKPMYWQMPSKKELSVS